MDSPALFNLAPTVVAQTASSDAAMLPAEVPVLDFAELLALGLAPALPADPAVESGLPATDAEDGVITAENDIGQPDLGALLLPDRLSATLQPAAQVPPPASLTNPALAAASDADAAPTAAPGRTASFAAGGEWLPPAPAEATGTMRTALADLLPATTSGGAAAVPDVTMTGWPAQPPAITPPAAPVVHRVDVPLSQPGWSDAFSSRVVWLAGQHQQSAELHVNPPELGPIDIVLSFDREQAHVHFSSAHLPVREAIETALPALRDALSQAGIQLGNTSVSAEGFGRPGEPPGRGPATGVNAGAEAAARAVQPDRPAAVRIGLVDTFA